MLGSLPVNSLGDFADLSDAVLMLTADLPPGDLGAPVMLKKGEIECKPGLIGDVAVGTKKGSTTGRVTAVCNAVKKRRGPAGLGITMTSGIRQELPLVGVRMVWTASLTSLKLERLVK